MQLDQAINALQDIGKAIHQADQTNFWLVVATITVAVFTLLVGMLNIRSTRELIESFEGRQKTELFERERPWITIDGPTPLQVVFPNNQTMSWEKFNESSGRDIAPIIVKVGMRFTNTGIRPARNLKSIDWTGFDQINRETLENGPEKDMHMDYGPNQIQHYSFDVNWNIWQNLGQMPVFFALRISYDNGRARSYSGVIYKLERGGYTSTSSWYN